MATAQELYLPEDCWESIFKIFFNECGEHNRYLPSLSVLSKQFLSVTGRFQSSLVIFDQTLPFLPSLLQRFINLTSLNLAHITRDRDALLTQISCFTLQVKSLNLSNHASIPANGLQVFSQKITTLTSLICSNIGHIKKSDLYLIAEGFPLLEELDLSLPKDIDFYDDFDINAITLALPKLRKVNLSGNYYINDLSIFYVCRNCEFLEEVVMFNCKNLTDIGIASAIRERPNLMSFSINLSEAMSTSMELMDSLQSLERLSCLDLSFSYISDQLLSSLADKCINLRRLMLRRCTGYSHTGICNLLSMSGFLQHLDLQNAMFLNDYRVAVFSKFLFNLVSINLSHCRRLTESTLFELVENCPSLDEIRMEYTCIGKFGVEKLSSSTDFAHMKMKSLHLAYNPFLNDETIKWFTSICPNLEVLDVSNCSCISEGIVEVLRCCKIMHLNLSSCENVNLHAMNFQVPMLEVLNLSYTRTDDKTLDAISKSCSGLLQLELERCYSITGKGVKQVVEKCTRLKEINLRYCCKVSVGVGLWMGMNGDGVGPVVPSGLIALNDSLRSLKRLSCLELSFSYITNQLLASLADKALNLRRLVLRRCTGYSYTGILYLLSRSRFLQHLDLQNAMFLNDHRVAELSKHLFSLASINLSHCRELTESTLFALVENCPFLDEIRMEDTYIGNPCFHTGCTFSSRTVSAHMEMKSLYLANNTLLNDAIIKLFASICLNLQLLDVNNCSCISDEGIVEVLRSCKIVHLNLSSCPKVNLHRLNFQVPTLEVLKLSMTRIDYRTLYAISKSCSGLQQLNLEECLLVTAKGVKKVIENCTRLKEINLRYCRNTAADVDIWLAMALSRPSLRKIMAPSHFCPRDTKWKPLLDHGCFLSP
ncbi:F-box/LRR-repeat protein 3-like [Trifolium pratense]|nr:F-box/LRR-repeat protein 3-like [Trifolium pratense]